MENMLVDGIYQHINNGGVSFGVTQDEYGVAVEVESTHFGNTTGKTKLYVTQESLVKLGEMFTAAADAAGLRECDYFKSEWRMVDKETGKTKGSQNGPMVQSGVSGIGTTE